MSDHLDFDSFLIVFAEELQISAAALGPDTRLDAIARFDSMGRLAFMSAADEKYGVLVDPDQMAKCRTVNDLYRLVAGGN